MNNPYKFLTWVIEVELDLVADARYRLITGELDLFDEVFVRDLGKSAAFIGVKVDVVYVKRRGRKRKAGVGSEFRKRTEFNVDLDLVVLKSNKRKGESRVAAKPEFERDVKISLGSESGSGSGHETITSLLSSFLRKFVPDVHPITVVFVDALTTDFNFSVLDKSVAKICAIPTTIICGYSDLKVDLVHKVTIT